MSTTATLSVVIPTLNAARHLPACLLALSPGRKSGLIHEILLADGGSKDQTITLAAQAGCHILQTPPGRGRQLLTAAKNARGSWLLFCHSDTRLAAEWPQNVQKHMQTSREYAAAFQLAFDSSRSIARFAECLVWLRATWIGLPYGDQGLLISRSLYEAVGGYSNIPEMEDLELVRKLGRKRLKMLRCKALTSAEKYERHGWLKQSSGNLLKLLRHLHNSGGIRA